MASTHDDFAVALQGDEALAALGVLHLDGVDVAVLDGAAVDRLDVVLDERAGRDAAGVERAHRELRARLADRLGGDDADGQAFLDDLVGAHVDAVAAGADAARALAGERAADADALELELLERVGDLVGDDLVFLDDRLVGDRVADRVAGRAADDHVLQLDLDRLALVDRRLGDAVERVAVDLVDDDVLRDVGELAGEVARVGGLQRRVGQALAGAVGRAEVLEHRQAFAEVGLDRRLDDLARGLGHQAAHAAELADLVDVTAGAGDRPSWRSG